MANVYKPKFVDYEESLKTFTEWRKELIEASEKDAEAFKTLFSAVKYMAAKENTVAMDILAYFYKTGVPGLVPENYVRYIYWELLSAARGNELAIEKIQFLIGYACDMIIQSEDFPEIEYKNDIDDYNLLYVTGKAIAKMMVKNMEIYPVDLIELEDDFKPYKKEDSLKLRDDIDAAIPKAIEYLKS